MLEPESLRSKPTNHSLKTYGRSKRPASVHARMYDWKRLEDERRARNEAMEKKMQEEEEAANILYEDSGMERDLELEEQLMEQEPHSTHSMSSETVPSTQGSEPGSEPATEEQPVEGRGRTLSKPSLSSSRAPRLARSRELGKITRVLSTQDSELDLERTPSRSIAQQTPTRIIAPTPSAFTTPAFTTQRENGRSSGSFPQSFSSGSSERRSLPQEKSFAEYSHDEDEEEDGDGADEVLFRTPSFDILQRLRQLPRPRFPEPKVNPFALGTGIGSGSPLKELKNPFLDTEIRQPSSPTIARRTKPMNLSRHQSDVQQQGSREACTRNLMDLDDHGGQNQVSQHSTQQPIQRTKQSSEGQIISEQALNTDSFTTPKKKTRKEVLDGAEQGAGQDDCVDLVLGKRISSIEITPRRMLAKQRRVARPLSASPTRLVAPATPKLFLDRDIPEDEQDDLDAILGRSTHAAPKKSSILVEYLHVQDSSQPLQNLHHHHQRQPPAQKPPAPSLPSTQLGSAQMVSAQESELRPPPPQNVRPLRQVRSLKRPPSVLVNNRKSVIRSTVDELLAICDQTFFDQFKDKPTPLQETRSNGNVTSFRGQPRASIVDFDALLPEGMASTLTKIGEASYSEVYTVNLPEGKYSSTQLNEYIKESKEDRRALPVMGRVGEESRLVMKVMPFLDDGTVGGGALRSRRGRKAKGSSTMESTLLGLEDISREAMVSAQIIRGWNGFIGSFGSLVVRGRYPKSFLTAWDRFRKDNGTESIRPDNYTKDQLYCIILLPYGGIDLEHCTIQNWKQAWSVLAQVAASLEDKEQGPFWFEHRDLHWGNILVKGTRQQEVIFSKQVGVGQQDKSSQQGRRIRILPSFGIAAQMIDFTLARVQGDKGSLIYMDLEKDQDLFGGQGDYQFEIYRKMRKLTTKDWASSCPRTNALWLHYLADKLLTEKNLQQPKPSRPASKTKTALKRVPTLPQTRTETPYLDLENQPEEWFHDRILAVFETDLDRLYSRRLSQAGWSPSGLVLDLLLDQP